MKKLLFVFLLIGCKKATIEPVPVKSCYRCEVWRDVPGTKDRFKYLGYFDTCGVVKSYTDTVGTDIYHIECGKLN